MPDEGDEKSAFTEEPAEPTRSDEAPQPSTGGAIPVAGTPAPPTPSGSLWERFDTSRDPGPPRPPTRFSRVVEGVAWVVGIAGVLFFGRVFPILTGARTVTPYEAGAVAGGIAAAILIGVVARWVVVRARRRGRVLSPWILVVAILVLLANLGRQAGLGDPVGSSVPIDSYLRIEAPYTLAAFGTDEAAEFKTLVAGRLGKYEVRQVLEAGQFVGTLMVADLGTEFSSDSLREVERGFEENAGAEAHEVVVGGRTALAGTGPSGAAVFWVERPFVLSVYAIDEESAARLAEAVMASYDVTPGPSARARLGKPTASAARTRG